MTDQSNAVLPEGRIQGEGGEVVGFGRTPPPQR